MKPAGTKNRISEQRRSALVRSSCTIALAVAVLSSIGASSLVYAIHVEPVKTSQFLIDRITSKSDAELDGAIILMHVGVRSTADALQAIIANSQGRDFQLVTISKLLQ